MDARGNEATRRCPHCARQGADGDVFCARCGARLPVPAAPAPDGQATGQDRCPERLPGREPGHAYEIANPWPPVLGGFLLLIASVLAFYFALVAFGALAAWLVGIAAFLAGLLALACAFGNPGTPAA